MNHYGATHPTWGLRHFKIMFIVVVSTATIEYSCLSVWCVCVCLSVGVHDNSKNNCSMCLKLEHIVVYENSLDQFDIGHCPIKVKVTA